ncbi:uncharacterized protein EI97DRAFT_444049 [Westerdykella ornata]|uniref:Uncharacterized protein n=1 Tax=Westerdykella ornata TaxID=318751 RepID=A0A6A6JDU0_WESOR|nr:uncharacterized protein EI97DRAFT_444049 [Westerdykella ornata]KAF2274582.1 hypothetical protein EI97DRAFT_444049 [Westerdykella ornata]
MALSSFVKQDLIAEGKISTKVRHKPVALFEVAEDLVTFLWKADEYEFLHSRIRLQLAFLIIILALAYSGYFLLVHLWYRKRTCNLEKYAPQLLLYEEPKRCFFCPVAYFLVLALADQAIEGCNSFTSLEATPTPLGTDTCWFKIKSSMLDVPILRSVDQKGVIHQDQIWKFNSISNMLIGLGQRAGYEENLTAYCFRRVFSNTIDKAVSQAQRRQLIGHCEDGTFQHYISRIVGADTQSLAQGCTPNQALIEEATSMKARRNLLAPMPPGSQLTKHQRVDITQTLSMSPQKKDKIQRRLRKNVYLKK